MTRTRNNVRFLSLLPIFIVLLDCGTNAEIQEADKPPRFQVLRAHAADALQLKALRNIQKQTQNDLDFWQTPSKVGHRADIMVDEDRIEWLDTILKSANVSYDVIIDDVERLIVEKEHAPPRLSKSRFSKRLRNEGGNQARYAFGEYHSYQTICDWMHDIERKYPDKAKVFTMGITAEGRPIKGIKIGSQVWRNDKRIFWIDGGIHAREWAAVHTAVWFIDRLIADYNDDFLVRNAVDRLNFYILPVANPDGYEYTRSDVSPTIRLWRKNRAGVVCKKDRWFRDRCCGGVDLNRNYDWHFGETGSSSDKCSEIYQGSFAFSEAETRSMRDFLLSPELNGKVDAFITLHTYSQMWIHPYSHARKSLPADIAELQRVGRAAVAALENTFGTKYKFGTGSDILYPSAGGSDDWAKGVLRVKYVYLLELRPGEDVWDGFILDQHQLIPTAKETWNGIKVVISAVADQAAPLPESIASTLPTITLPPPPPATAATTVAPWTTTWQTTMHWTTPPTTVVVPISSIFIHVTESAPPIITTTTPTHLDASYKLGKRRFKFVSIKTFSPTLPTSPIPFNMPLHTITPATPTFSVFPIDTASSLQTQERAPALVTVGGSNENSAMIDDFEGSSVSRVRPTFARRPNGGVLRTINRHPGSRQFIHRLPGGGFVQPRAKLRMRMPSRGGQVTNFAQRPVPTQQSISRVSCVDRSPWCASWLSANSRVCQISAIYMRQNCTRTCRFC